MELLRRLWYLLNRSRFQRELEDEIAAHREMKGPSGPAFGNVRRIREEADDAWGWGWWDRLGQDLRFAGRLLRASPSFTVTATGILALGVGVNLAAFQVFDAVALSWLPVRSPETLVRAWRRSPTGTSTAVSYPSFDFYRARVTTLSAAMALTRAEVTFGDDRTHRVPVEFVTGNYFEELGAVPAGGRLLAPSDDQPGSQPVIVLGEDLWRARLSGDVSIIGGAVRINDRLFTVVGIVPRTFVGLGAGRDAWIPLTQHPAAFEGSTILQDLQDAPLQFYGRLQPGVSQEAAEAELRLLADARRLRDGADVWDGEWLDLQSAGHMVSLEQMDVAALALVAALILLVLVTACMNLGLLLLARSVGREREFAIRLSVGATRRRIVRQLVTEHLLIAAIGAVAACVVSAAATRLLLVATGAPAAITPDFSVRVALVAVGLALLASFLFGFTPAVQALKPIPRRLRFRNTLVAVQVGAACVLLIVSGLLVRGVLRVTQIPLGFEYERTLVLDPDLQSFGVEADAAGVYWRELEARVRRLDGVAATSISSLPPLGDRTWTNGIGAVIYHVTPSFFDTMQIPITRGRVFSAGESGVAIASESLARRVWPGGEPLGQAYQGATVVGIAGDARTVRLSDGSATEFYLPAEPAYLATSVMVVRTTRDPHQLIRPLQALAREVDSRIAPAVEPLRDKLEAKLDAPKQVASIISALGACALLLAITGLAGLVSFTVSQRTREIGVRVALGARGREVVLAMVSQFAWPTLTGFAAGGLCAVLVATVLSSELFGVSRLDPVSYGGAAVLFAAVSAVAMAPALRRATRVDPVAALRHE